MVDRLTREQRSANMRAIRSRDTEPELLVRRLLHRHGYRYRLNLRVQGFRPDIVFPARQMAIFVHGCFWHRHPGCRFATNPSTRPEFWRTKFERNVARDTRVAVALAAAGWEQMVVWECETHDPHTLSDSLRRFLGPAKR